MIKSMIKFIFVVTLFVLFSDGGAVAQQYPPMDMSGMMQRQIELQQQGDRDAYNAGMQYYYMEQQLRAQGIEPPAPPASFQQNRGGCTVDYNPESGRYEYYC
jgi:hypothetical protein